MPVYSSLSPYLIVLEGGIAGTLLPLSEGPNTLGRAADNAVQLIERTISRHHAILEVQERSHAILTDLNSSNGTFVNEIRLSQGLSTELHEGDHLRFGTSIIVRFVLLAPDQERKFKQKFDESIRDELTGIYKMDFFLDRVVSLADRFSRDQLGQTIAMTNIDHFRLVNERHGSAGGDAVLREAAHFFRDACGSDALVARVRADLFIITAPSPDQDSAVAWANRIRQDFGRRWFNANGSLCRLTTSFGVGFNPPRSKTAADAIANAELCLIRAKTSARDCVVYQSFDP